MKKIHRLLPACAALAALLAPGMAHADSAPASTAPTFTGFIDSTYNYNFSGAATNPLRSFDSAANTVLLNDVQLKAAGNAGKEIAYTAKVDYGTDATAIHSNLLTSTADVYSAEIEEAYFNYTPNLMPDLMLTVGKFVTYEGIEVIESGANPTISRGCLFGMAEPYTTTGAKVMYTPSSKFMVGAGVVNGWDLVQDNNSGKTGIAQVQLNLGDPFALSVQGSYGPEEALDVSDMRSSFDAVLTTKVIPKVTLMVQGNYGSEPNVIPTTLSTWKGVGVQPIIDLSSLIPATSLGLRYENMVNSDKTRMFGLTSEVNSFTATPTFALNGNLTFRLEYRYDQAVDPIYTRTDGKPVNNDSTFSTEFIQTF